MTYLANRVVKTRKKCRAVYLLIDDSPALYQATLDAVQTSPHLDFIRIASGTDSVLEFDQPFCTLLVEVRFAHFPSGEAHFLRHLIITEHMTLPHALQAFQRGVAGYMHADNLTAATLVSSLMTIAVGGIYIDPSLIAQLLDPAQMVQAITLPPTQSLNAKQRTLLRDIALGLSNKQMAHRYNVTVKTISNRLSQLYSKIAAKNRVEAAFYALQCGIVTIPEVLCFKQK